MVMDAKQIKDEIRKLSRIDKTAIYKWIDEQAAADLPSRIGVYRSRVTANQQPFVPSEDGQEVPKWAQLEGGQCRKKGIWNASRLAQSVVQTARSM